MRLLVTGGAGFIGSALVRQLLAYSEVQLVVVDKLSYAASREALPEHPRLQLVPCDIAERSALEQLVDALRPEAVVHLAAETHVDRSIDDPSPFIASNIVGTFTLLEVLRHYLKSGQAPSGFRYLQVSTDEVFGSCEVGSSDETSPYAPRSPYAASKASADHLARAYQHTYGLPLLLTYCSNNYGPFQFPEKLIPLVILKALSGAPIPIYGRGDNVRDWLYVDDHVRALIAVLQRGTIGQSYAISSGEQRTNLELVQTICQLLTELAPARDYQQLITFVADRPGHDRRYALDSSKLRAQLGWQPQVPLAEGLRRTVTWYLEHRDWCRAMLARYDLRRLGAP